MTASADLRLVETLDGWTLDLELTDELLAALTEGVRDGRAATVSVTISPNLVPGEPFEAELVVHHR